MTESELERLVSLEALTAEGGHQVCPTQEAQAPRLLPGDLGPPPVGPE